MKYKICRHHFDGLWNFDKYVMPYKMVFIIVWIGMQVFMKYKTSITPLLPSVNTQHTHTHTHTQCVCDLLACMKLFVFP